MVCPQCASTEGIRICVEMIQAIKGVHGIHIMAYRQEERVSDIVKDSGAFEGESPLAPGHGTTFNSLRG